MKKWIFLLRSFFPKWVFFDRVAHELHLEVCYGKDKNQMSDWLPALPPIERSYRHIFLNSQGNYLHACHNHLSHFNSELSELKDSELSSVAELTTYQITRNLAQFQIEELNYCRRPYYFKFRLLALDAGGDAGVDAVAGPAANQVSDLAVVAHVDAAVDSATTRTNTHTIITSPLCESPC